MNTDPKDGSQATVVLVHGAFAESASWNDVMKTIIQHQLDATDRQIDQLVYELYDLTDEEIAIVEEAS
jgi:hypothetical protein